jgi:hypothetical protein
VPFLSKEVDAMLKQQIKYDLQHFDPQIHLGSLRLMSNNGTFTSVDINRFNVSIG